jgi:hypothetical protein
LLEGEERGGYHFGMFRGLPRGVVVGLGVVLLDIVAILGREAMRGVSGVRSAVAVFNVCLLSVLNVCMLFVMCKKQKMATLTGCFCIRNAQRHREWRGPIVEKVYAKLCGD